MQGHAAEQRSPARAAAAAGPRPPRVSLAGRRGAACRRPSRVIRARRARRWKPPRSSSEIEQLLDQETFEPPEEFRASALVGDESLHERAKADPEGFWAEQARELHWFEDFGQVLDESNPPFYKWFTGRQAQRVLQLPRPPRRGGQRRQGGLPLARRGGRGARRDLRRPPTRRPAAGERAQGARHQAGRRGRDLPADDPRGGRGDARLRARRRAPQRGLRRLLAGVGQGAHGVLGGQGADHDQPGAPQGQGGRHQAGRRRDPRRPAVDRDRDRGSQHRPGRADDRGPRPLVARGARERVRRNARPSRSTPSTRCTCSTRAARRPSRRASSTPRADT